MLIVCTQDPNIRGTAEEEGKGGEAWAPIHLLPAGGQPAAGIRFREHLRALGAEEPLCLSAHGNDNEIGDEDQEGWQWTAREVAELLRDNVDDEWEGPILIHACATRVANFSANLAVILEEFEVFNGLWCYGYNRAVPSNAGFPDPANLDKDPALQGTQVNF